MKTKNLLKTAALSLFLLLAGKVGWGQPLLVENFDYTIGELLTNNGWTAHSAAGTQPIDVTNGLVYPGYLGSGIGGAANLDNNGEDVNRTFNEQTSGSIYAAFLIKTESTNSAGYFLHFGQKTIGTTFFSRVWVNATGDGLGLGSSTPSYYEPITPGTPTLVVVKYEISTKTSSLFVIDGTIPSSEPTADTTFTETASITNVGSVALRQYNANQRVIVDGIRVATSWQEVVIGLPTWTSGYPVIENITHNAFDLKVNINEPGTAYYVVLPDGSTAPTSAQVKAGTNAADNPVALSGSISITAANTDFTGTISGLTPSIDYDVYVVAEDDEAAPNLQASPEKIDLRTADPDITAPVWTTGYPKVEDIANTDFNIKVNADEACTAYYVVLPDGSTAPDSTQVKNGQDGDGNAAFKSGSINITAASTEFVQNIAGLTAGTTYDVYVVAEDASSNLQDSPSAITDITTTNILPKPSNHATDFLVSGVVKSNEVTLTWTDAVGAQLPEGYVILINTSGSFTDPTNGSSITDDTDFSDDAGAVNVAYGVQTYTFNTLVAGKTYYARIYPYTNSGSAIDYKVDGTIPETNFATPIITVTSPNGGERFFAGDEVTITWSSANMDAETIKCEAWVRQGLTTTWGWLELAPVLPNTGSFSFTIPADAKYGTQYKIRLTGNTSSAVDSSDAPFTIIATPSIYDIQIENNGSPDWASQWENDSVRIGGIVTAVASGSKNYYLQAGTGEWSGIYVYYNTTHTYQPGDSLIVIGKVLEFNKLTELSTTKAATVVSSGNTLPAAAQITTASANTENYEGVLVKVTGATCSAGSNGNYTVNDGSGDLVVYKSIYTGLALEVGRKYDITGVMGWFNTSSQYQLYPRSAADIYLYSNDATLSDLKVDGTTVTGFDPATLTYNVELPYGTSTVPTVTYTLNDPKATAIKTDAAALPGSTTVQVTAEDGSTQTYTINFTVAEPNHEANILTFTVAGVDATIDNVNHTITATVPYTTDITNLVATFTLSAGASAKVGTTPQVSGTTANDFSSTVEYTVTAEDGTTTQKWEVTITKETEPSHDANITAYSIGGVDGTIDAVDHTVTLTLPFGTDVTALVATFTLSAGASAKVGTTPQESGTTPNDFTSSVVYTVTAEDGTTTQNWRVTVNVTPASTDATVSSTVYTVSNVDGTITNVPYNATLATFKSNITPAAGATFEVYQADGTTVATDLQTGYKLICTAQDGTTKKTYTITLNTPPATSIVYEPFDYTVGTALQGQGGWTALNTGDDLLIATGNLSYPDLAPSTGNKLSFAGGGIDAYKEFSATGITSGKVYYSFILKVTDLTKATEANGGYFIGFAYDNTNFGATAWTKRIDDNTYKIGVATRTSTTEVQYSTDNFALNSDIFVVVSNEFVDGTGNDIANIWINPASQYFGAGTEPTPTLTVTNTGGTDLTSIKRIFIRQDSDTETPAIELDELRVGDTWAQVTPAGALSSDATVTSTVYTVDSNAGTITNVPQTETLANFKANITPAAGATFEVYQADGTTVATDLQTGYKLICTAEDGVTRKTYTITLNTSLSNEASIISYSINGVNGTIDNVNHTVTLTLPFGTDVTALVATFTLSAGASAKVGTTPQESGTTPNDFTSSVVYTVTAEDGTTTQNWGVTVNVTPASTANDITSFTISGQVSSTIDAGNAKVIVVMPYGTSLTSLTPTIVVSEYATISPASGVAQDFTNPVTYTVTAQDGTTKAWTVTVTIQSLQFTPIYQIQYTTATSGDSPLKGQQVRTKGVVTAVKTSTSSFNIWIQDSAKAWNGVYVYGISNSMGTIAQGDSVEIVGTVDEYNNLTEIKSVSYLNKTSSGNTLPAPVVVTPAEAASEAYEGVLVQLTNVECTVADAGYGMFEVSDGTNTILIDDDLYKYTPSQGMRYNIVGLAHYSYNERKILPRAASDIEVATTKYNITFNVKRSDGTTAVADATITVTGQGSVTTDANGVATMQLPNGDYSYVVSKTNFNTYNGTFTVADADQTVNITLIQTGITPNPIAKLNVYPNPFTDRIYFTGTEVTRVTITSVIGQVVMDRQVENTESVDVSSLDRGIYLVRFYNSKGESVLRKMVKE